MPRINQDLKSNLKKITKSLKLLPKKAVAVICAADEIWPSRAGQGAGLQGRRWARRCPRPSLPLPWLLMLLFVIIMSSLLRAWDECVWNKWQAD